MKIADLIDGVNIYDYNLSHNILYGKENLQTDIDDSKHLELAKDPKKNVKALRAMVDEVAKRTFPNSQLIQDGEFRCFLQVQNAVLLP